MSLKPCRECGKMVSTEAKVCPHCGKKYPTGGLTRPAKLFLVFILLVAIGSIFSNKNKSSSTSGSYNANKSSNSEKLTASDFEWKRGKYGNLFVVGTVKNNTSKNYSYVQINFNVYDKSGSQIGSALGNVNNLEAHGTWNYEVLIHEENAESVKLKEVTGY